MLLQMYGYYANRIVYSLTDATGLLSSPFIIDCLKP
jgi:hypothetical protein